MKLTINPLHGLPPRLNCVATLPCEGQKSKIPAEPLLIPWKLLGFNWNL